MLLSIPSPYPHLMNHFPSLQMTFKDALYPASSFKIFYGCNNRASCNFNLNVLIFQHFSSIQQCKEIVFRSVHYIHFVMNKCIIVKLGGKRKTHKVCKKHKFSENREKNFEKWGKNNFREIGGKCIEIVKMGGKFKICG